MASPIRPDDLKKLRPLGKFLKQSVRRGDNASAGKAMTAIQVLLKSYGHHHRLLECKLWYYEGLLDASQSLTAESGFSGIRQLAAKNSRLHAEASFFLAICFLRQKRLDEAKVLFRRVISEVNKLQSPDTRRLLQKRILQRIEEESVLAGLIGLDDGVMNPDMIQKEAVILLQKPQDEIMELMGRYVPPSAYALLQNVRNDVFLQLPVPDQKLLPAPGQANQALHVGKRAFAVLHRIGWSTFCDPQSALFKLWSKKTTEVYTAPYFATAIIGTFTNWKIGLPMLAAGVVAIAMKYGAQEFCALTRPDSIMETRRKGEGRTSRTKH